MVSTKLQFAQLDALTNPAQHMRQKYGNKKGRGYSRGGSSGRGSHSEGQRLRNEEGCFRCGAIDHWAKECKEKDTRYENEERYDEDSDWHHAPRDATVNQPRGGERMRSY